jgi:hypothetical protein
MWKAKTVITTKPPNENRYINENAINIAVINNVSITAHMFIRPMCVFRKPELPAGHFSRSGSGSGGFRKMTGSSGIGIGTGYPAKHYRFSENTHWPDKHMGRNISILN